MKYTVDMTKVDGYYTTDEAAEELGISQRGVQKHIERGNIDAIKVGRAWLIPHAELDKIRGAKPGRPPSDA